jgi:NAD(P)-dependent dehydrogenase (short-subunit alcohol dehydrogenase family)
MDLTDKVALITGGKRIGAEVSAALAGRGAHIGLSYRKSREEAEEVAARVVALGRRATCHAADLSRPEDCRALVSAVASTLGRLDILVSMASRYVETPFDRLSDDDLDTQLAVDVRATYLCARAAIPHMRAAGGGRIVTFADWLAKSGRPRYPGFLPYYVGKAAVVALTEALALELAPDAILVNAVAPGPILPPPGTSEAEKKAVADATPLGRWGGETEIAKAVVALIEADFITGETIRVDGGRHLK